mgnify:CR=1 FL=1
MNFFTVGQVQFVTDPVEATAKLDNIELWIPQSISTNTPTPSPELDSTATSSPSSPPTMTSSSPAENWHSELIFTERFDGTTRNIDRFVGAGWNVVSNENDYAIGTITDDRELEISHYRSLTNFRFQSRFLLTAGILNIEFHRQLHGTILTLNESGTLIVNRNGQLLGTVAIGATQQWRTITIEVAGTTLSVSIDESLQLQITDQAIASRGTLHVWGEHLNASPLNLDEISLWTLSEFMQSPSLSAQTLFQQSSTTFSDLLQYQGDIITYNNVTTSFNFTTNGIIERDITANFPPEWSGWDFSNPSWSATGTRIAFECVPPSGIQPLYQICVYDFVTQTMRNRFVGNLYSADPTISPDGSMIAFIADSERYERSVYFYDYDLDQISPSPIINGGTHPIWEDVYQYLYYVRPTSNGYLWRRNYFQTGAGEAVIPQDTAQENIDKPTIFDAHSTSIVYSIGSAEFVDDVFTYTYQLVQIDYPIGGQRTTTLLHEYQSEETNYISDVDISPHGGEVAFRYFNLDSNTECIYLVQMNVNATNQQPQLIKCGSAIEWATNVFLDQPVVTQTLTPTPSATPTAPSCSPLQDIYNNSYSGSTNDDFNTYLFDPGTSSDQRSNCLRLYENMIFLTIYHELSADDYIHYNMHELATLNNVTINSPTSSFIRTLNPSETISLIDNNMGDVHYLFARTAINGLVINYAQNSQDPMRYFARNFNSTVSENWLELPNFCEGTTLVQIGSGIADSCLHLNWYNAAVLTRVNADLIFKDTYERIIPLVRGAIHDVSIGADDPTDGAFGARPINRIWYQQDNDPDSYVNEIPGPIFPDDAFVFRTFIGLVVELQWQCIAGVIIDGVNLSCADYRQQFPNTQFPSRVYPNGIWDSNSNRLAEPIMIDGSCYLSDETVEQAYMRHLREIYWNSTFIDLFDGDHADLTRNRLKFGISGVAVHTHVLSVGISSEPETVGDLTWLTYQFDRPARIGEIIMTTPLTATNHEFVIQDGEDTLLPLTCN